MLSISEGKNEKEKLNENQVELSIKYNVWWWRFASQEALHDLIKKSGGFNTNTKQLSSSRYSQEKGGQFTYVR